ncbi:unnamed protein product, partial [Polarella glacialis]
VLPRALFLVRLPAECTPTPLSCGPWPTSRESIKVFATIPGQGPGQERQVAWQLTLGGVAFAAALFVLERAFGVGLLKRFAGDGESQAKSVEPETSANSWKLPW